MVLALVVSLLAGQTIYEWVDAQGESHFTDDASTIPAGAKRRVTKGADIAVTPAAPKPDAGVGAPKPDAGVAGAGPDSCALARARVSQLEKQLQEEKGAGETARDRESAECQQVLRTQGEPGFARCMAGRTTAEPPTEALLKQLEAARETLRRAQVSGCR